MPSKFLTALPVYNEVDHVDGVLDEVLRYSRDVLVVDDGSTDGTAELLASRSDIRRGHARAQPGLWRGAALGVRLRASTHDYDVLVTIDCDGQHQPQRIPEFVEPCRRRRHRLRQPLPAARFAATAPRPRSAAGSIVQITAELNRRLGLNLTDAFCGFKAYRVRAGEVRTSPRPAMPCRWSLGAGGPGGTAIVELPVPLIYLDEKRSFGGSLDDADTRLAYYHRSVGSGCWRPTEAAARARAKSIVPRGRRMKRHGRSARASTLCERRAKTAAR